MTYSTSGDGISGSDYLDALASLRELLVDYPIPAQLSAIHVTGDPAGRIVLVVGLGKAEPVVVAAGIVAWQRTLAKATTWVWRTSGGDELHIAITGHAPDREDMTIVVLAGPVPHDCRLDHGLEPGAAEEFDAFALYDWLAGGITNDWPFRPPCPSPHLELNRDCDAFRLGQCR